MKIVCIEEVDLMNTMQKVFSAMSSFILLFEPLNVTASCEALATLEFPDGLSTPSCSMPSLSSYGQAPRLQDIVSIKAPKSNGSEVLALEKNIRALFVSFYSSKTREERERFFALLSASINDDTKRLLGIELWASYYLELLQTVFIVDINFSEESLLSYGLHHKVFFLTDGVVFAPHLRVIGYCFCASCCHKKIDDSTTGSAESAGFFFDKACDEYKTVVYPSPDYSDDYKKTLNKVIEKTRARLTPESSRSQSHLLLSSI
jgi:hypothetical protein